MKSIFPRFLQPRPVAAVAVASTASPTLPPRESARDASASLHDVQRTGKPGRRFTALPRTLALVIAALVFMHFASYAALAVFDSTFGVLQLFDLAAEQSLGTWVNAALLAAVALAAAAAARSFTADRAARRGWWALAALFLLGSLDEVASFHESTVTVVRSGLEVPDLLVGAAWVIPAIGFLIVFAVWQWRFLTSLPHWLRVRLAVWGSVFVIAALGLEMAESKLYELLGAEGSSTWQIVLTGIEEGLEMSALAVILLSLLRHLGGLAPLWHLEVSGGTSTARLRVSSGGTDYPLGLGHLAPDPQSRETMLEAQALSAAAVVAHDRGLAFEGDHVPS